MKSIYFVLCLLAVSAKSYRRVPKPNTLRMVHAIFRHAQRTPDESTIYPNDPYKNMTYEPYGIGSLTSEGFKTQYALGRALRSRYGNLIGDYSPRKVKAISSPYSRTKVAMQLVLAGLFPPVGVRNWNPNLQWQPIDFDSNQMNTDLIFLPQNNCENLLKLQADYFRQGIRNNEFPQLTKISEYLSTYSGWNVTTPLHGFLLYAALLSEEEWGLELPEWTTLVYPDPLHSIAVDFVASASKHEKMKTLAGGFVLKRISEEIAMKIDGIDSMLPNKISLYSGHDFTIIAILSALGIYEPHLPTYAAYILIELHEINNVYGVKVFYNDYTKPNPQLMSLPGCGSFCPFDKFLELYSQYFAVEDMCTSPDYLCSDNCT